MKIARPQDLFNVAAGSRPTESWRIRRILRIGQYHENVKKGFQNEITPTRADNHRPTETSWLLEIWSSEMMGIKKAERTGGNGSP